MFNSSFRSSEKIAFSQFEHLRARCLHVCWVRACVRPCSLGVCSSREVYGEIFESNFFMSDCAELDVTSSVRERETWPCKLLAYLGKWLLLRLCDRTVVCWFLLVGNPVPPLPTHSFSPPPSLPLPPTPHRQGRGGRLVGGGSAWTLVRVLFLQFKMSSSGGNCFKATSTASNNMNLRLPSFCHVWSIERVLSYRSDYW